MGTPRKPGRPSKTGDAPAIVAPFRMSRDTWDDLGAIYGDARADIARQLLDSHLRRPGVPVPPRPSPDAIASAAAARSARAGQDTAAISPAVPPAG